MVVRVVGAGIWRYERQKVVAGGPRAFITLRTISTCLQVVRFFRKSVGGTIGFACAVPAMEIRSRESETESRIADDPESTAIYSFRKL